MAEQPDPRIAHAKVVSGPPDSVGDTLVINASVVACVRLPRAEGRREEQVAEFATTTRAAFWRPSAPRTGCVGEEELVPSTREKLIDLHLEDRTAYRTNS